MIIFVIYMQNEQNVRRKIVMKIVAQRKDTCFKISWQWL